MTQISQLPDSLNQRLCGKNLIVFDGKCVFCSAFFRFMFRHDRAQSFHYATAQSPLGQALYAALNLPLKDFETNPVIIHGEIHQRLDAFAAAMAQLPAVALRPHHPSVAKAAERRDLQTHRPQPLLHLRPL